MSDEPCSALAADLQDYVDGQLPGERVRSVEDHLASCPECRCRAGFLRSLKAAVGQAEGSLGAPALLRRRLEQRLSQRLAPTLARGLRWGLAAASFLLLSLGAILIFSPAVQSAPLARALAEHHLHCWQFVASPATARAWQSWLTSCDGKIPLLPRPSRQLVEEYDVRACQVEGEPYAYPHLLYRCRHGGQLSIFALPATEVRGHFQDVELTSEPQLRHWRDLNLVLWERKGWIYALVAPLPEGELRQMALACR